MMEASSPAPKPSSATNVTDLLARRVKTAPHHVAFDVRRNGDWQQVTTADFDAMVRKVAGGLIAAGVGPGDRVAIMSPTRYEWVVVDLAAWYAGAVVVPIYETSAAPQVQAILRDAMVAFAVAGSAQIADVIEAAGAEAHISLQGLWTMDKGPRDLHSLIKQGRGIASEEIERRRHLASDDSLATIVYTSGTTAAPKGVLLAHRDLIDKVETVAASFREVVNEDGNTVIFLPLAHVLARALQLCCLAKGMRIAHLEEPKTVLDTLGTLQPSFLVVVPHLLAKIVSAADAAAARTRLSTVWQDAKSVAIHWGRYLEATQANPKERPPRWLALRHSLYDALFYPKVRKQLGGNIGYLLSGAARLDGDVGHFFRGIAVPVIEGYGLTETTAPITANLIGDLVAGCVGTPLPGVTVRIASDGEVLVKGCGVSSGYQNPELNADAFVDGFFRTGDVGTLDDEGRLRLQGRTSDLIVTSNGKTVSPTEWESVVEEDPLVANAVMIGESYPYLTALILVDQTAAGRWATRQGFDLPEINRGAVTLIDNAALKATIRASVEKANALRSRAEQVRNFAVVLADLTPEGGLVTPTLKLKRSTVIDRSHELVSMLYGEAQ